MYRYIFRCILGSLKVKLIHKRSPFNLTIYILIKLRIIISIYIFIYYYLKKLNLHIC